MKFDIWVFLKYVQKIQESFETDKNSSYPTCRPLYIYNNTLTNSSYNNNWQEQQLPYM